MNNLFVITGGPGTGKTSVINELRKRGYDVLDEAARTVHHSDKRFNGKNIKEVDMVDFQKAIFDFQKSQFESIKGKKEPIFMDRGIGDSLAYYKHYNLDIPKEIFELSNSFKAAKVFCLNFLDIYRQDKLRKETKEEQEQIHYEIIEAYGDLGYDVVFVPKMSINERVDFILSKIQ